MALANGSGGRLLVLLGGGRAYQFVRLQIRSTLSVELHITGESFTAKRNPSMQYLQSVGNQSVIYY